MATTKKKPKKKTSQSSTWSSQAGIEALLKYGPQQSALQQLYSDAQSTYQQQRDSARFFAGQEQRALEGAGKINDEAFKNSQAAQAAIDGQVQGPLLALGGKGGPGEAAALAGIQTGATQRNAENLAYQRQLGDQKVQAAQRGAYQEQQAGGQLAATIEKILGQRAQLAQEQGLFTDLTYDKLHTAAQKLAHDTTQKGLDRDNSRGNALISAGFDPSTGAPLPGKGKSGVKGLLPGGAKPLEQSAQNTVISNVKSVANLLKGQRGAVFPGLEVKGKNGKQPLVLPDGTTVKPGQKLNDHAIRQLLQTSRNPLGKAFSPDEINAAFDIAVKGGLSKANIAALHKMGVKIQGRLSTKPKPKKKPAARPKLGQSIIDLLS